MIKKRLLSMLVLLLAALTGAWAQEAFETIATTSASVNGTHFTITSSSADANGMHADAGITVTAKSGEYIQIDMTKVRILLLLIIPPFQVVQKQSLVIMIARPSPSLVYMPIPSHLLVATIRHSSNSSWFTILLLPLSTSRA